MPANNKNANIQVWFVLKIGGAEAAAVFQLATGLEATKAMGNTKWSDIELKRGVGHGHMGLWNWRKLIVDGKREAARKDCTVTALDSAGQAVATYSIINAWPKQYTGVGLEGRLQRGGGGKASRSATRASRSSRVPGASGRPGSREVPTRGHALPCR